MLKERKVGEFFTAKNFDREQEYVVVKGNYGCINCCAFCYTRYGGCESPEEYTGICQNFARNDKQDVHFEKVVRENGLIGILMPLGQRRALGFGNLCSYCNNNLGKNVAVYVPLLNEIYSKSCFKEVAKNYSDSDDKLQKDLILRYCQHSADYWDK